MPLGEGRWCRPVADQLDGFGERRAGDEAQKINGVAANAAATTVEQALARVDGEAVAAAAARAWPNQFAAALLELRAQPLGEDDDFDVAG